MAAKKGPRPKHIPQRTCIVCRQKQDKRNLVRLVRPRQGLWSSITAANKTAAVLIYV
jgi:predicted RNA-binding protein YlxR (DUF448 family)